jgi:glycosyltransferase involved in cell wall biosynthesis
VKTALVYALHSGELYGTERMAIATLAALREDTDSLLLAPRGPAVPFARDLGLRAEGFAGARELAGRLDAFLRGRREAALIATGVGQSLAAITVAARRGVRLRHLHAVHGGTDERLSYGRKKWLVPFGVDFVAVSEFVRGRLVAHGVPRRRVRVVGNFLTREIAPRETSPREGTPHVAVVSRLDPIKRVDLLLDALDALPNARSLDVRIHGTGWERETLEARARRSHPNVVFAGYTADVAGALRSADLLVHTCPEEPFGLVVLEAMAAGTPVLVPDCGGPGEIVTHGRNGFLYRAGDARSLARALESMRRLPSARLRAVADAARQSVRERHSPHARIADYRALLQGAPS